MRCDSTGGSCSPIGGATGRRTRSSAPTRAAPSRSPSPAATRAATPPPPRNPPGSSRPQAQPRQHLAPDTIGTTTVGQQLTAAPGNGPATPHRPSPTSGCAATRPAPTATRSAAPQQRPTPSVGADSGNTIASPSPAATRAATRPPPRTRPRPIHAAPAAPVNTVAADDLRQHRRRPATHGRTGSWTGNPAPTFTYQWIRCDCAGTDCAPIGGATTRPTPSSAPTGRHTRRRRHRQQHQRQLDRHLAADRDHPGRLARPDHTDPGQLQPRERVGRSELVEDQSPQPASPR